METMSDCEYLRAVLAVSLNERVTLRRVFSLTRWEASRRFSLPERDQTEPC